MIADWFELAQFNLCTCTILQTKYKPVYWYQFMINTFKDRMFAAKYIAFQMLRTPKRTKPLPALSAMWVLQWFDPMSLRSRASHASLLELSLNSDEMWLLWWWQLLGLTWEKCQFLSDWSIPLSQSQKKRGRLLAARYGSVGCTWLAFSTWVRCKSGQWKLWITCFCQQRSFN